MSENTGPQSAYSIEPGPPRERADAARNRKRILDAAERLFRKHGVANVSMDQIAAEAHVGKGTLFRRFGDKAGLAVALLDSRERDLQAGILSGPPPLGPGAPPKQRLIAFVNVYLDFLDDHLDLVYMSESASPGARYRIGSYRLWHRHVAILIAQARPELDADFLAHALLAPLSADQRMALRNEIDPERLRSGLEVLTTSILHGSSLD
jgi:AcrR family transcriptional regulator